MTYHPEACAVSFPRKREPMATRFSTCDVRWSWVLACAGTTVELHEKKAVKLAIYSALMCPSFTTRSHFFISFSMKVPNSDGLICTISAPSEENCFCTSGEA